MTAPDQSSDPNQQNEWDVIVIGSGMGGMATASALSQTGHKVLILEQYQKLGGLTHSFSRNGFSWDVGIHYLSFMAPGEPEREILDWLCDTPIELAPMGAVFDVLHIGDAAPLSLSRPYEAQVLDLKERFPDDGDAIDEWFAAVHAARDAAKSVLQTRSMPRPVGEMMEWWKRGARQKWCGRTTAEVAADITDNRELAAALCAQWGDHGGRPSKASFSIHALIAHSYLECGGWYPVGGASVFVDHILPVITAAGGEARVGVRAKKLLMEDGNVVGVRTSSGDDIRANTVVSSIGARETVDHLVPAGHGKDEWVDEIRSLSHGICHFSLHLGFKGNIESAGATKANHWLYPTGEVDVVWTDAPDGLPPVMVAAFSSLKDPNHDPGPEQYYSGEIMVWTDWSTVERWADKPPGERGEDYAAFKERATDRIMQQFAAYFPDLAELVVFKDLSTPLSTESITGHRHGAFYGLDVTPDRMLSDALRMKTPIKGLYFSGQDPATPGIPGAMWGGVLCAATIDPKVFMQFR